MPYDKNDQNAKRFPSANVPRNSNRPCKLRLFGEIFSMTSKTIRLSLLLLGLSFCSCSGKTEAPKEETAKTQPKIKKPEIPKADPIKAPVMGSPNESGYTDESIRVQIGPDESLREQQSPSTGKEFLLVRWAIHGTAKLVPKDYRIVIEGKQYTPHAIGFGRPNGVYDSVDYFVGEQVDLVPGTTDQILHDGERIQKAELKNPLVFLVFEVPQTSNPTLWHGTQSFALHPDYQKMTADLSGDGGTLTSNAKLNMTDPNAAAKEFSADLLNSTRTRMQINGSPLDVVVLTIGLGSQKSETIELKKNDIALRGAGGSSKGRTIYVHFSSNNATLTAGSTYSEGESYEGKKLIALDAGSFRLPLTAGTTTTMTLILPDPKIPGDLELQLTSAVAVQVPEPVNPLGKFPPPVEKMPSMVAWSPLVGSPINAGYLPGQASIAKTFQQLSSPSPQSPGDGLQYLMVRFRVERESQFVPIDYRLAEQESNTVYRPVGVAFGESAVYVKGMDYDKLDLTFGTATAPKHQGGKLKGWTLKTHEITLLYEVAPAKDFVFIHGTTQFVIEL